MLLERSVILDSLVRHDLVCQDCLQLIAICDWTLSSFERGLLRAVTTDNSEEIEIELFFKVDLHETVHGVWRAYVDGCGLSTVMCVAGSVC